MEISKPFFSALSSSVLSIDAYEDPEVTEGKHLCRTNIVETRIQRGCGHLIMLEGINDMQSKMNNQTREGKVGKKHYQTCMLFSLFATSQETWQASNKKHKVTKNRKLACL